MLEMLLSPRKAERRPWEMFFVGIFYALISLVIVQWIFAGDTILSRYSSWIVITFTVMFSMPFMYYLIKNEEQKDLKVEGMLKILKSHSRALRALMWLFMGFLVSFSIWYMFLDTGSNFKAQVETFCAINYRLDFDNCVQEYSSGKVPATAFSSAKSNFFGILFNNINVLILTLIFSLIIGAGAIFVLAWNATVIATATGIFIRLKLSDWPTSLALPTAIMRYMLHGVFEIGAYFVGALAGGIISVAIIKHDIRNEKFWDILQDSINLIIFALILLVIGGAVEVFITPTIFNKLIE